MENEKIIFGGLSLPENQLMNDCWIFNYSNLNIKNELIEIGGAYCNKVNTKG